MPFLTTTGGLNFSYPTDGTTNWGSTLKTSFNTISAHNHTGAPNGVQLGTNSLQNNAIIGSKFRLLNDTFLRGRNAADSADINILKVTTGDVLQFGNGTSNATISAANITLSGSGTISSSGPFVFPAGTVSAPSVTFTGDLNTGFYNIAADTIGAATNGVERVRVDTAAVTSTLPYVAPAGTVSAPSLTFASDLNTGFYQIAADTIGVTTNGVERVRVDTAAVTSTLPYVAPAGTAGAPSLTFASDLNTGFYNIAADTIGVATAGAERIRVDSSGNVGIGGTPSGYKFHLQTDGNDFFAGYTYNNTDGNALRMWRARGTAASPSGVVSGDRLASIRGFGYSSTGVFGTTSAAIDLEAAETFTGTAQGGQIIFRTTANGTATVATERVRIDDTGRVGIGATPSELLHLKSSAPRIRLEDTDGANTSIYANISGNTAAEGSIFIQADPNNLGTNSNVGIDVDGTTRLTVSSSKITSTIPYVASAGSASAPSLTFTSDENTGFFTPGADAISATTGGTERMRILSTGDVGIGTTSTGGYRVAVVGSAASSKTLYLHTDASRAYVYSPDEMAVGSTGAQALIFVTSNTERARITSGGGFTCAGIYSTTVGGTNRDVYVDSGGVVGYVTSIRDSKTEIQDLTDISWMYQLNPVSFKYRKRDENGGYTDETDGDIQYGMIAEEVQPIRPDLCFYDEVDGRQELRGIHYSKLTAVLLKAVQDLNTRIAALEAQVTPQ